MKNKKKVMSLGAGILGLTVLASTWAYYSSTMKIDNELQTKNYGNRTIENFTPKQEMEPGSEITKEVGVVNTGDYDLVVRIKMEEKWARGGTAFIDFDSSESEFHSVVRTGTSPNFAYASSQYDFDAAGSGPIDGKVDDGTNSDESVMYKTLDLTNWIDGGDGYWYYNKLLGAGLSTGDLLKSLVLSDDTDMGKYITSSPYYSIVAKDDVTLVAKQAAYDAAKTAHEAAPTDATKAALDLADAELQTAYAWTSTKPTNESTITFIKSENAIDNTNGGYANADYTLSIITEVCQATEDAVDATWVTDPAPATVKSAWGW